jgi:hypothetical protein
VGAGTQIDHVMVNAPRNVCFEFLGGTVSASHLVCNDGYYGAFHSDLGHQGTLDTLFSRITASLPDGVVGLNISSPAAEVVPRTTTTVTHATFCGKDQAVGYRPTALEFSGGAKTALSDVAITGYEVGVNLRDPGTEASIEDSYLFGMTYSNFGDPDEVDEEEPLDEATWFAAGRDNATCAPGFLVADCLADDGPNTCVTGSGVGAFSDDADWMRGGWVKWEHEDF